jgi:hypothetical protein
MSMCPKHRVPRQAKIGQQFDLECWKKKWVVAGYRISTVVRLPEPTYILLVVSSDEPIVWIGYYW